MRSYEFLPHTADIRMKLRADSLSELFYAGLLGMSEILVPGFCSDSVSMEPKTTVEVEAADLTALLVDFLSEVLTLSSQNKMVFCEMHFIMLSNRDLVAELAGAPIKKFGKDIKAVTYHEAEVKQNEKGDWETTIIFDI